ncbi:MAG TPA: PEGA domain-containing protein [Candidatus Baltobacteraceae bacterium]|nr:PEGA domain-containing protein [Candidatus Baltobacteraceae bacterium]
MQPSRRHCLCASVALVLCLLAPRTHAETLTITSSPPGATVEIDGLVVGSTPYESDFPGGYFHKTHTAFGTRLEHSMVLRVSKDGYLSQQITLTSGPFDWVAINGRHRGSYFLLKARHFEVRLDPVSHGSGGPVETIGNQGPMRPAYPALKSEAAAVPDQREGHASSGSVAVVSDPPGAEIYVDGKFVGQTPSTIELPAGSHHVEVKSAGKQDWARDLDVLKDSQLTLHPVLDSAP